MQAEITVAKIVTAALIAVQVLLPQVSRIGTAKEYRSTDGRRVLVANFAKPGATIESKIEFYSADNRILCALDYSSDDGEHGFGMMKGAWTPDQKYFVFSLASSGGHQAWHAPTLFYSAKEEAIQTLDNYVDGGISKGDFVLKAPNTVVTEVWRGESQPVRFRLGLLARNARKPAHAIQCTDGRIIKPEG